MSGEVPRGGIEEVLEDREDIVDLEGREDVDLERSTKASFGLRGEVDLEISGVDFERSDDSFGRVEVDFEPSNDSFDRVVIVDFEKSALCFMKVPAVEVFTKSGESEAGLVRAVVIVIDDEVLMDVATEYKLPEVLAVERIDEEGSRLLFVPPTDSPSREGILDCVSPKGFLGPGKAPKLLGGGGSSSRGGGLLKANACL